MNTIIKLFKYTTVYRTVCRQLQIETYKLYKKTYQTFPTISRPIIKPAAVVLNVSLLTWLGFAKGDEEKESELITTIKRAVLLTQRGELPKAEQMLHIALRLAQQQQNQQGITYIHDLMANVALERGEADKAKILFVNVLQSLLSQGMAEDDIKVIHISLKLARICEMQNDSEKAEVGYQWCLDSIKKKQDNEDVLALTGAIEDWYAKFLLQKGQIRESLEHLKEAHRICTEIEGNSEKSVLLLNDIGTANWKLGDLKSAEECLNLAILLGKNIDDFHYLGIIYANLGLIHLQNGVINKAKQYCNEGQRLGKSQNNDDAVNQANYCFEQIKITT